MCLKWECRFSPKDYSNAWVWGFRVKVSGDKAPLRRWIGFVGVLSILRSFWQSILVRDLLRLWASFCSILASATRFQMKFTVTFLVSAFGWPYPDTLFLEIYLLEAIMFSVPADVVPEAGSSVSNTVRPSSISSPKLVSLNNSAWALGRLLSLQVIVLKMVGSIQIQY
jgi:hypothetical protein